MDTLSFLNLGGQELIIVLIGGALLQILTVVNCLKSHFVEPVDKIAWMMAILFIPIIGPLLWIFLDQRTEERR
ncbi:MAG: hypothetical protein JWO82_1174 [Akkermansiaceae bacterium]|nr:hypothetical protein [Akkermansiaceae bacterium]